MELTKEICGLIAELEYLIGSECYNPNSYDGWNDVEGRDFRYPISLPDQTGNYRKVRGNLNKSWFIGSSEITPEALTYMI